jgi:hypothetical protein
MAGPSGIPVLGPGNKADTPYPGRARAFSRAADALRCVQRWQRILRLADWDVAVEITPKRDVAEGKAAHVHVYDLDKRAVIQLIRREDWREGDDGVLDHEWDVVHELLHLHLAAWTPDEKSLEHGELERAIAMTAWALISLDRRTPKPARRKGKR